MLSPRHQKRNYAPKNKSTFGNYRLPSDFDGVTKNWSSKGRVWVTRYGITEREIKRYSIGYSEWWQRVVLPVYNDGELYGYQLRRLYDGDERPKYITRANKRNLFWHSFKTKDTLVIVEDILSGIKCARIQDSLALLTVSISSDIIDWVVKNKYKRFFIFLDNDNRQVKQAQIALKNRLSLLGEVKIIHADRDPKEHSEKELEDLLR